MPESPSELYKKRVFHHDRVRRRRSESWSQLPRNLARHPRPYEGYAEWIERIKQRDEFTCQACGKKPGAYYLIVHHRNGDKTDQSPENLITVCTSCHRRLHPRNRILSIEELKEKLSSKSP